jgi:hypothetical protein
MSRIFSAPLVSISVTNDSDQDILEMVGAAGYPFRLLSLELSSSLTTDERVALRLVRRSTTGSGGSAITEVKNDPGSASPQTALSYLVTSPGTVGDIIHGWQWSQLAPFVYRPTPEEQITVASGGRLCLNLQTAVASTRTWSGYVVWAEEG